MLNFAIYKITNKHTKYYYYNASSIPINKHSTFTIWKYPQLLSTHNGIWIVEQLEICGWDYNERLVNYITKSYEDPYYLENKLLT